ncbi:isoprenylcysteine carboxylmethyltransferase family protein [Chloroflexota bacterium]|nr:isoprenylcysteine carboxylmethyltransferase family protein [Chloroflexota bacterium]
MNQPLSAHLKSFILPFLMLIALPASINYTEYRWGGHALVTNSLASAIAGAVIGLAGLTLLLVSIRLIIVYANTTVMPWIPSEKLVIRGPYRYVRNPMILGVVLVMVSEGLLLGSNGIFILALVFFLGNTLYFILSEEPKLEERFGEDYHRYKTNVRRWVPRLKPWKG